MAGRCFVETSTLRNYLRAEIAIVNTSDLDQQLKSVGLQSDAVVTLKKAKRHSLRQIFSELPPPNIATVSGEFEADLLHQGDLVGGSITRWAFQAHGPWMGKAFHPKCEATGEGYNIFRAQGGEVRKLRMDTYIGDSIISKGDSMVLDYSNRERGAIRWLVGELRQLDDTTILGMGVFEPLQSRQGTFRRVIPFVLSGPVRPYQFTEGYTELVQMRLKVPTGKQTSIT